MNSSTSIAKQNFVHLFLHVLKGQLLMVKSERSGSSTMRVYLFIANSFIINGVSFIWASDSVTQESESCHLCCVLSPESTKQRGESSCWLMLRPVQHCRCEHLRWISLSRAASLRRKENLFKIWNGKTQQQSIRIGNQKQTLWLNLKEEERRGNSLTQLNLRTCLFRK